MSPVGHLADAEDADQRVELVGQRDRDARRLPFGQRVAGEARPVVLRDRAATASVLAVVQRVIAAHDALQLGELAHHLGQRGRPSQSSAARSARPKSASSRAAIWLRQQPQALDALGCVPSLLW